MACGGRSRGTASCAGPSCNAAFGSTASTTCATGRTELIRCPTLITLAEADPLTAGTQAFFEALRCPKDLIRFAVADGAGDHCEMLNCSRLNRSVLDWLDGVLGCGPR